MKVTKWSTYSGDLNVSEQQGEPISGETGSVGAGPAAPGMSDAPVMAHAVADVASPQIAPDQEQTVPKADTPKADAPKAETPKAEVAKAEVSNAEAGKAEVPKVEIPKVDAAAKPEAPSFPGKLMIMSPGDRVWDDSAAAKAQVEEKTATSGKRRVAAMAAVVVLATVAGALGGALATAGFGHFAAGDDQAFAKNSALEASIARIDADMLALKASVEHTAKLGISQFSKTSDRLDKVEKAQAEPAAKLAKLSEAVDKLRTAPPAAAPATAAAAAKDVTGTVTPLEVGRLPTVEGWVLRDVSNGGALIEGRRGIYEVYAGDPVPGLGRVDAIRRQDGRWVVVTTKGLIVAR
jgi:hypothetical protein